MSTITERVAAGAAFLDENDPEWWRADVDRAIDLSELNLGNGSSCVLGQRCPLEVYAAREASWMSSYYAWASTFADAKDPLDSGPVDRWAAERGFQLSFEEGDDDTLDSFPDLTAEWKRVITERRSA